MLAKTKIMRNGRFKFFIYTTKFWNIGLSLNKKNNKNAKKYSKLQDNSVLFKFYKLFSTKSATVRYLDKFLKKLE
jgi:hypothetical protein